MSTYLLISHTDEHRATLQMINKGPISQLSIEVGGVQINAMSCSSQWSIIYFAAMPELHGAVWAVYTSHNGVWFGYIVKQEGISHCIKVQLNLHSFVS